jgi:hypothetical protein
MKMVQWQNEDLTSITADIIDVKVRGGAVSGSGGKQTGHIEFVIVVSKGGMLWTVMRRYSQFRACFTKLRHAGMLLRTDFPPKLRALRGGLEGGDLRKRQLGLARFLVDCLSAAGLRECRENGNRALYERASGIIGAASLDALEAPFGAGSSGLGGICDGGNLGGGNLGGGTVGTHCSLHDQSLDQSSDPSFSSTANPSVPGVSTGVPEQLLLQRQLLRRFLDVEAQYHAIRSTREGALVSMEEEVQHAKAAAEYREREAGGVADSEGEGQLESGAGEVEQGEGRGGQVLGRGGERENRYDRWREGVEEEMKLEEELDEELEEEVGVREVARLRAGGGREVRRRCREDGEGVVNASGVHLIPATHRGSAYRDEYGTWHTDIVHLLLHYHTKTQHISWAVGGDAVAHVTAAQMGLEEFEQRAGAETNKSLDAIFSQEHTTEAEKARAAADGAHTRHVRVAVSRLQLFTIGARALLLILDTAEQVSVTLSVILSVILCPMSILGGGLSPLFLSLSLRRASAEISIHDFLPVPLCSLTFAALGIPHYSSTSSGRMMLSPLRRPSFSSLRHNGLGTMGTKVPHALSACSVSSSANMAIPAKSGVRSASIWSKWIHSE